MSQLRLIEILQVMMHLLLSDIQQKPTSGSHMKAINTESIATHCVNFTQDQGLSQGTSILKSPHMVYLLVQLFHTVSTGVMKFKRFKNERKILFFFPCCPSPLNFTHLCVFYTILLLTVQCHRFGSWQASQCKPQFAYPEKIIQ